VWPSLVLQILIHITVDDDDDEQDEYEINDEAWMKRLTIVVVC